MTKTNDEKRNEYVNSRGLHCPHCGSKNMSYEDPIPDPNQGIVLMRVKCNSPTCKKSWEEVYSLTNVFLEEGDC